MLKLLEIFILDLQYKMFLLNLNCNQFAFKIVLKFTIQNVSIKCLPKSFVTVKSLLFTIQNISIKFFNPPLSSA